MSFLCFHCQSELEKSLAESAGRRDECPKCKRDLHACKNCKYYDLAAYNECREPQAERVVDKSKSNFCDFFKFGSSSIQQPGLEQPEAGKNDYLKQLDALFK